MHDKMNQFPGFLPVVKQLMLFLLLFNVVKYQLVAQPVKGNFESSMEYRKFLNPPADYRSFPFYSINDSLDASELKSQIQEFARAGFGGFYLHSRDGLLTEFLGKDWWTAMNAAVEAARSAGLEVMFYDEDKWPSGYAGGIIPLMSEDFRAKSLVRIKKQTPLPPGSIVLKEDSLYKYIQHTAQMGNPIFNGTCWVDLFNPEMVAKFLEVAYRPYLERFAQKITDYRFAIFADEPHIHARYFDRNTPNEGILSYSPWVAGRFKSKFGYDLLSKVNLLFEEKENWREVRLQYFQAVAEQFDESFARQVSQYCESMGVKFTGHFLGEDGLEKVRDRIGNSMMHYRWMQQPGMDLLGLSIAGRLLTARSVSSVANQFGIPRRLSEMFGISGQNMNFEDRKWIAGWHAILGINHFCPHLTLYSMKGLRKRDYPPTFSYQQPYWPYNKKVENYMGRLAYAATVGKYLPQLLVLNPLESEFVRGNRESEFTEGVQQVMERLQENHYDYDLGDEQILADSGKVVGQHLQVGQMLYQAVLLPDMMTIRSSTVNLLLKFCRNGGKIFCFGRLPQLMDGKTNETGIGELKRLSYKIQDPKSPEELTGNIPPTVAVGGKDASTVWSQVRKSAEGYHLLLFNTSHTNSAAVTCRSELFGKEVVLWNPSEGKCFSLKADQSGNFELQLAPSNLIWISSGKANARISPNNPTLPLQNSSTLLTLGNQWQGRRLSPNALTLDFAAYSIDNGLTFSEPEPVIGIFNRLSDQSYRGELLLRFDLIVEELPKSCQLVLEQPNLYHWIMVNGKPYHFQKVGFYKDHQFISSKLTGLLQKGKNSLTFSLPFRAPVEGSPRQAERYGTELESIYLTGDFGVACHQLTEMNNSQRNATGTFQPRIVHQAKSFSIQRERSIFSGDVSCEGYPFFAGAFELKQTFDWKANQTDKKYFLELPNCEAIATIVKLNGSVVDTLCWAPFQTDISRYLKPGKNELKLTMVNSLRNLLGPHHHNRGELIKVGPASFTGAGGFPDGSGENNWYDLRKSQSKLKIWSDTYHFIPFGLLEPVRINVH